MTIAIVFPGQGSQSIGMGQDLAQNFPCARLVFEEVDEALGEKLSALMFEGTLEDLSLTRNTQPALMAVSLAVVRVLEQELGLPLSNLARLAAGHSLGEYSALTALGVFDVTTCTRLLRLRGEAMQSAVPLGVGAMAVLMGGTLEMVNTLTQAAAQDQVCMLANDNATDQQVISGHKEAVERAIALAPEMGFKRALPLRASAPFHSSLMAPAALAMKEAFEKTTFNPLPLSVVANVTAETCSDANGFRTLLVTQVAGQVRWRESLHYMANHGITRLLELGAGKVLCGLAKRTTPDLQSQAIGTVEDIKGFLEARPFAH
jgi:[acyl-carrier-protein] S-malonyltransferase